MFVLQVYERNPLCGINYPCGEAAHLTNTCLPLDEHHDDGNLSNYTNISDHMTGHMTMEGNGMIGMMTTTMSDMMNETVPTLPRGFRVCNQPNTFLWSVILALATFFIAFLLRKLRYKNFLGKKVLLVIL